jgi:DNA-binding transcriptional regulator YhcF (GntR family)
MVSLERINHDSEIPKYKQVVELITSDIEAGIFKKGQRIPSINETSEELLLSRDTVEKAYVYLRKKGILSSVRGKGYYVNQVVVQNELKVALVFNKLSNYKRSLYYSFVETMGSKADVNVFIYNYSLSKFEEIIENQQRNFDYFVILPQFAEENVKGAEIIRKIDRHKVLLIDRNLDVLKDYPVVYQEFEKDIQRALNDGIDLLKKYKKTNLVFPKSEFYSKNIKRGFRIFCQVNELDYSIIDSLDEISVKKHQSYVLVADNDLYRFVKICQQKQWKPGTDVGIVAYNDNPVKEILEGGITTISTNHDEIGRMAAQMILSKDFKRIKSPFQFIQRKSL